jgi:hypothetical protein
VPEPALELLNFFSKDLLQNLFVVNPLEKMAKVSTAKCFEKNFQIFYSTPFGKNCKTFYSKSFEKFRVSPVLVLVPLLSTFLKKKAEDALKEIYLKEKK